MDRQQAPAGLTEPLAMRRCKGAPPEARIWTMRQSSRASSRSSVPPLVSRERDRDLRALVRTFLSWALALEIAGRWPWQREPLVLGELSTRADKYDVLILGG